MQSKQATRHEVQQSPKKQQKGLFHLILGAGGIYLSYVILAIYSQKLYNSTYKSNIEFQPDGTPVQHKFVHANAIVWLSAFCCSIFGLFRSLLSRQKPNPMPLKQSIVMGVLFAINMLATNVALLYISYPTQVIARNSRYLFVILVGSFLSRVPHKDDLKLPKHKIYVALFITLGVILFNAGKLQGSDKGDHHAYPEEWKGYLLLLISMFADAFLCDNQAYNKALFKPSVNQLFVSTNLWAFILIAGYAIATGSFLPSIQFILEHPQCLKQLALVCVLQVTGQVSIYYIVGNFKQHIFPLISATRKIITIVCSILLFNHTLTWIQWVAVGIVFAGMIVEVYQEITEKREKKKNSSLKQGEIKQETKKD